MRRLLLGSSPYRRIKDTIGRVMESRHRDLKSPCLWRAGSSPVSATNYPFVHQYVKLVAGVSGVPKFFVLNFHELVLESGKPHHRFGLTEFGLDDPKSDLVCLELNVDAKHTYNMEWQEGHYRLEYTMSINRKFDNAEIRIYEGPKVR
jgi:hypothetical protein